MYQIIAITQITMKRLLNYQRVTEKNANAANQRQWVDMTLETMRTAEKTRRVASQVRATVGYAGYLFRVQNKMTAYRPSYCDGLLHNALVNLMNTIAIDIDEVDVDDNHEAKIKNDSPLGPTGRPPTPLVLITSNSNGESQCCR